MRSSPSPHGPIRWPVACCASRSSSTLTRTPRSTWTPSPTGSRRLWRSPSRPRRWSNPLPTATLDDRVENVVLRRGSTRLFRRQRAPSPLLEWGLAAAGRAVPLDAAPAGTLLEHLVSVHDVADAEPGGYRYTPAGGFEGRTRSDNPRAAGTRLCLDQPLGGDSAYTVFHAAALDPLLDTLGGRGDRAAHLEAGIAAGRLALNAVALGHGATGLTFYDSLVSRYFHTESSTAARHRGGDPPDDTGAKRDTRPARRAARLWAVSWPTSPPDCTAQRPAIIHAKPETGPRSNGAPVTRRVRRHTPMCPARHGGRITPKRGVPWRGPRSPHGDDERQGAGLRGFVVPDR